MPMYLLGLLVVATIMVLKKLVIKILIMELILWVVLGILLLLIVKNTPAFTDCSDFNELPKACE